MIHLMHRFIRSRARRSLGIGLDAGAGIAGTTAYILDALVSFGLLMIPGANVSLIIGGAALLSFVAASFVHYQYKQYQARKQARTEQAPKTVANYKEIAASMGNKSLHDYFQVEKKPTPSTRTIQSNKPSRFNLLARLRGRTKKQGYLPLKGEEQTMTHSNALGFTNAA